MRSTNFEERFDGTTAAFLAKLAELCPRELTKSMMDRLIREGELRTLLSTLPNHHALRDVIKVINGEASIRTHKSFRVQSDGKTGQDWLDFFEGKVSERTKEVLLSDDFKPTNGVRYNLQHAPGKQLNGGEHSPTGVKFGSNQAEPVDTSLELSCLIREQMAEEDFRQLGYERGLIGVHHRIPEGQYSSWPQWGYWLIAKWPDEHNDLCLSAKKVSHSHSLMGGAGYIFCTSIVE